MAKIIRKTLTLFGTSGPTSSYGQFGSKEAGTPQTSKDPTVIQQLAAWVGGWQVAVVNSSKAPFLEDMNGWCFVHSYMVAYGFQAGIPEWDAGTTYFVGSVVQDAGSLGQWFVSLQDNNTNNAPPIGASNAFWRWANPPESLSSTATLNKVPKVTNVAPGTGAPGSVSLGDSAISEDGVNVIIGHPLKFPDNSVQSVAASPISTQNVVTGSRVIGNVYQNTTGRAMIVVISVSLSGGGVAAATDASLNPTTVVSTLSGSNGAPDQFQMIFIVLPGNYYKVTSSGSVSISLWTEWA